MFKSLHILTYTIEAGLIYLMELYRESRCGGCGGRKGGLPLMVLCPPQNKTQAANDSVLIYFQQKLGTFNENRIFE